MPWRYALWRRVCTLWLVKMTGTALSISGFFILYFWVMHNTPVEPMVMPVLAIDRWIATSQLALLPYASLWVYVSLPSAFAASRRELIGQVEGAALMAAVGLAVFWVWPTELPAFPTDWSHYPALAFLKARDGTGNAFPSLHVAFAAYAVVVLARQLRGLGAPAWTQWINALWFGAIVYSTLATRQHVAADVLGGLALAAVALAWGERHRRFRAPRPARSGGVEAAAVLPRNAAQRPT